jgi:hypothetical protein
MKRWLILSSAVHAVLMAMVLVMTIYLWRLHTDLTEFTSTVVATQREMITVMGELARQLRDGRVP